MIERLVPRERHIASTLWECRSRQKKVAIG
jgi:hypothetical protein